MRLVAFGILAAMLSAGCAFEAGDPGDPGAATTDLASGQAPKVRTAATPANSAAPNPEPSPWDPGPTVSVEDQPTNADNPEPSPWRPINPVIENSGNTQTGKPGAGDGPTTSTGATLTSPAPVVERWNARSTEL